MPINNILFEYNFFFFVVQNQRYDENSTRMMKRVKEKERERLRERGSERDWERNDTVFKRCTYIACIYKIQ